MRGRAGQERAAQTTPRAEEKAAKGQKEEPRHENYTFSMGMTVEIRSPYKPRCARARRKTERRNLEISQALEKALKRWRHQAWAGAGRGNNGGGGLKRRAAWAWAACVSLRAPRVARGGWVDFLMDRDATISNTCAATRLAAALCRAVAARCLPAGRIRAGAIGTGEQVWRTRLLRALLRHRTPATSPAGDAWARDMGVAAHQACWR